MRHQQFWSEVGGLIISYAIRQSSSPIWKTGIERRWRGWRGSLRISG